MYPYSFAWTHDDITCPLAPCSLQGQTLAGVVLYTLNQLALPKVEGPDLEKSHPWKTYSVPFLFRQLWLVLGVKLREINSNPIFRVCSQNVQPYFPGIGRAGTKTRNHWTKEKKDYYHSGHSWSWIPLLNYIFKWGSAAWSSKLFAMKRSHGYHQ